MSLSLWDGQGGVVGHGDPPSCACSMQTPWLTCWINGGLSGHDFSGNPAFSTVAIT